MPGVLHMWTIYDHPPDHPRHFVVWAFDVTRAGPVATDDIQLADSLDEARELVPPGLYCMARDPMDDPVIVETWL